MKTSEPVKSKWPTIGAIIFFAVLLVGGFVLLEKFYRNVQRYYGHVPLTLSVKDFMQAHRQRCPNSWDELFPYLEARCASEFGWSAWMIREEYDLAWGVDPVAVYRLGDCEKGKPIIFRRDRTQDVEKPWCLSNHESIGKHLVSSGLTKKP